MDISDMLTENQAPLTDWKNEPSVADLKSDYQEARSTHDYHVSRITTWLDNLYVTGSAKVKKVKGRSTVVPKLIRKQAEWRYAALSEPFLSTENLFKTDPQSWEDRQAAIQNGIILNNQFNNKINKVKFIDDYIRTAVDEGTVIVRVGWKYEEDANGKQTVNQPTVDVCHYNTIIVDPTCYGDLDNASFVIHQFETSLSDLEKQGKYTNLENIDIESNSILNEPDSTITAETKTFNFQDKPRKKFVAYEYWGYWDIDNTGMTKPIVATWVGDTMIRMEENPFPDGKLPFVLVQYLPKRFSVYGEPDGELLEDNQKIVGAVTRGMIDILGRSAAGQKAIRVDALDVTNRRKFEMGEDYEFNSHVDPRAAFYDHTFPEIPQSAQFMLQLQNLEAEALTGVKAFSGGISGDALGKTATGARGALDAASKRELGILRRLSDGIVRIGRKVIAMNAMFLSEKEVVRITNEEFVEINREDLTGSFDIKLDISTVEAENQKAQELAFMLQTMGNNMDPAMSQMILSDIARLRKMPDLAKRIEQFKPQPSPQSQLELQKLQAEIAQMMSQAKENEAEGMLDMARAQTEQMKARQLSGKADMQDLDFMESQMGIKHNRDLEKQGAQARANMQLKALDKGLGAQVEFLKDRLKRQGEQPQPQPEMPTGIAPSVESA